MGDRKAFWKVDLNQSSEVGGELECPGRRVKM